MNIFSIHKSPLFIKIVFVLAIFIMLFVSALTYRHIQLLSESSKMISHTYKVSIEIEQLYTNIKDLEIERRNYLLTKNNAILKSISSTKNEITKNLIRLNTLTKDNQRQKLVIERLDVLIKEKFEIVAKTTNQVEALSDIELKQNLLKGKLIIDKISIFINEMLLTEKKLLEERTQNNREISNTTPIIIYVALFCTIAIITLAFIKISRDLEETRKINEQLALYNDSNNLAEQVGEYGTWSLNLEKNEYTFSENEYRLMGEQPNSFEATLENFFKYIHPDDLQYVKDIKSEMVSENNLVPFKYRVIRADGEIRYLRGNGATVINKRGEKILIGTTSDITDEFILNLEKEAKNRELEANNKELQAFNYVASHDLQEPLRKIQTFISRLIDKDLNSLSENSQQYLLKIQDSSQRMRLLIDDLLQFSRTNKSEKVFEKGNLNELLENSKNELVQIIEDKKAIITNEVLPTLNVIPFQMQQLFTNLINNSLKYSQESIAPIINISVSLVDVSTNNLIPFKEKTNYYKIEFKDNGIGFEQQYAQKIFQLFNRLHNKDEYSGTGIGLAICKKIIDNHKGFIFAEGQPNLGATFTIYLPEN